MRRGDAAWLATVLVAATLSGCGGTDGGPIPIALGRDCDVCRMSIQNLHYACERLTPERMHMYDSIECLLRDSEADGPAWLADYDTQSLHAADSMWIVKGDIPSPMGGGLAAFLDRQSADEVAGETQGTVLDGEGLLSSSPGGPS
jgi:nitrous oxide reductase accessory protein NosL